MKLSYGPILTKKMHHQKINAALSIKLLKTDISDKNFLVMEHSLVATIYSLVTMFENCSNMTLNVTYF